MRKLPLVEGARRKAEREIAEGRSVLTRVKVHYYKPYVSLSFLPVDCNDDAMGRMDLVYLMGLLYITCCRTLRSPNKKYKEFYIDADYGGVFRRLCTVRFDSYQDVLDNAVNDPVLNLLVNCTNLSQWHFDAAARNYGVRIPIGYDLEKYEKAVGKPTHFCFGGYSDRIRQQEDDAIQLLNHRREFVAKLTRRNN